MIWIVALFGALGWSVAAASVVAARQHAANFDAAMKGWKDCNEAWSGLCNEITDAFNKILPRGMQFDSITVSSDYSKERIH